MKENNPHDENCSRNLSSSASPPKSDALLLKLAKDGDSQAEQQLFLRYRKRIVSFAGDTKDQRQSYEITDLIQLAAEGFVTAIRTYPSTASATEFWNYARKEMRRKIADYRSESRAVVYLPENTFKFLSKLERAESRLGFLLGRIPSDHELAVDTGLSVKQIQHLRQDRAFMQIASLDQNSYGEDADSELKIIAPSASHNPEQLTELLEREELFNNLIFQIASLDEKDQYIITARFGLNGQQPKTFEEIGKTIHVSPQRVRERQARALRQLRTTDSAQRLHDAIGVCLPSSWDFYPGNETVGELPTV